ncbi:hypothetical protein PUN50_10030 [Vibrio campbellii]|uniref:DUF1566 domain-containing protein n=1 Tax=Vibrio campbellii TaxID=680 RepID=A0AAQ2Y0U1_9VIBR|nr:hypothetical protein [Vibrio campbellii]WDG07087.1 hypothetical protein PUN50_10030 [Vibrio campbellii]
MSILDKVFPPSATLLLGCALLLVGCGQDQTPSASTPEPEISDVFYAGDGIVKVHVGKLTHINILEFVQGGQVEVIGVRTLEDESICGVPKLNGKGFDITAKQNGLCTYEYEVEQQGEVASGEVTVLILDHEIEFTDMPPVAASVAPNGSVTVYNLRQQVGTHLIQENCEIIAATIGGSYPSIGTIAIEKPYSIAYTPPDLSGWNRIEYLIKNPDSGNIRSGALYITVSNSFNQPPTIGMTEYSYNYSVENFDLVTRASLLGCQSDNCDLTTSLEDNDHVKLGFYSTDYPASVTLPSGTSFNNKKVTLVSSYDQPVPIYADNDNDGVGEELLTICYQSSCKDEEALFINIDSKWQKTMMPSYLLPGDKVSFELHNIPELQIVEPDDDYWGLGYAEAGPGLKIRKFSEGAQFDRTLTIDILDPGLYQVLYVIEDDRSAGSLGMIEVIVDSPKVFPCGGVAQDFRCIPITPNHPTRNLYVPAVSPYALRSMGIEPDATTNDSSQDPAGMNVGLLNYDNNVKWCEKLAEEFYAGRSDWHIPTVAELQKVYKPTGLDGYAAWPTSNNYWTSENSGPGMQTTVNLSKEFSTSPSNIDEPKFPVCISRQ